MNHPLQTESAIRLRALKTDSLGNDKDETFDAEVGIIREAVGFLTGKGLAIDTGGCGLADRSRVDA